MFMGSSKSSVPKQQKATDVTSVGSISQGNDSEPSLSRSNSKTGNGMAPQPQEAVITSDKTYTNHMTKPTRRGKASKRHMVDGLGLSHTTSVSEDGPDAKHAKDSTIPNSAKKMVEDDDQRDRSTASEAADDYPDEDVSPKYDSSQASKITDSAISLRGTNKVISLIKGKLRNKKVKGKSRTERDMLKERILRRDNSIPDDKDETSSTTTDSSAGGEQEDKNSNARDSTPEPIVPLNFTGSKKSKKNKHDKVVAAVLNGDVNDDDNNFELTSKSKAHRKIRVNPKIYGGDIMRPSTLDLPYTLPKEKEKNETNAANEPSRRNKKARGQPKSDLSELSIQTESFAQQTSGMGSGVSTGSGYAVRAGGGLSPDHLSNSSRSSSYSSIVSATGMNPTVNPAIAADSVLAARMYGDGSEHHLTMMQQLQAERRQRIRQHQLRVKKEDWPGFDVPPIRNDSLWDTDYNPLDPLKTWSPAAEPPSTSSASGANTFSPFSTPMADIWKPASTSTTTDTTWGQFLPPTVKEEK
nr:hypothetical protein BaRGS_016742 [Batillaria attramentaria]